MAVISAGWDPGSDSIVRTLLEAAAPKGLTYTNFGPGMSMGHTVCVKSKAGVKNALSMTMPKGDGMHRRMVYVELEDGARLEDVAKAVKEDPYFASDETHVMAVESVDAVKDMGHGVHMVRKGVSGKTRISDLNSICRSTTRLSPPSCLLEWPAHQCASHTSIYNGRNPRD